VAWLAPDRAVRPRHADSHRHHVSSEGQPLERLVQVRHGHGRNPTGEDVRTVIISMKWKL
jgi:hypothetical protein